MLIALPEHESILLIPFNVCYLSSEHFSQNNLKISSGDYGQEEGSKDFRCLVDS
jgi:hypothetical protein